LINYNPKSLQSAITGIEKVIKLSGEQNHLRHQLKYSLIRIQRAYSKNFWVDKAYEIEKKKVTKELKIENPDGFGFARASQKAKRNLMNTEKSFYFLIGHKNIPWDYDLSSQSWETFKIIMKQQWEKDQKRLLKDGEIKKSDIK